MAETQLFGSTYLTATDFRSLAEVFGVGMSLADYPSTASGDLKLTNLLAAASRAVDAFCGKSFDAAEIVEKHALNRRTWRFSVNNGPVSEIVSCVIRLGLDNTYTVPTTNVYVNNEHGWCEILRAADGTLAIANILGTELLEPQVEVTYKSLQAVPSHVRLATGYQAGHMMNSGFVDKILPPNFGKVDLDGLSVNNKKGYRSADEMQAGSFSPDASRLLQQEIRLAVA